MDSHDGWRLRPVAQPVSYLDPLSGQWVSGSFETAVNPMPMGPQWPNPWAVAPMQVAPMQEAVPVTAPVAAPFPAADTIPPP